MFSFLVRSRVTVAVACMILFIAAQAVAQSSKITAKPPVVSSDTSERDAKAAVIASKEWQQVRSEFHQWLAVQVVMTPDQVERMKAKLDAEVQSMSATELEAFLYQWNAKLKILLGKDAGEAREWLGQNLSVMADGYRAKFLKDLGLTNPVDLTAAQIEDRILRVRAKHTSMVKDTADFNQLRRADQKLAKQFHDEWRAEAQQATKDFGKVPEFNSYQSQYSPQQKDYGSGRYRSNYPIYWGGYGYGSPLFW